jgi:hypothetical protein
MIDTSQQCFSEGSWHATSAYWIAIPSLLLFVFGLPIALGFFMHYHRNKFNDSNFKRRFGFIYVGLRPERWWWFFIGLTRTSIIACIGMLVYNAGFQNLVAQGWILSYLITCFSLRPYLLNTVFYMEIITVACIMSLLYINLWILFLRVMNSYSYDTMFGILCIIVVSGTAVVLLWMTTLTVVASDTGDSNVTSSDIKKFVVKKYSSVRNFSWTKNDR